MPRDLGPILKTLLFTILVPGVVAVYVPYILLGRVYTPGRGPLACLGIVCIVVGTGIYFRCAWEFAVRGLGTPAPIAPTKFLVVTGLHRYVRNPMYIGVALVILGQAALFHAPQLAAYAAVMLLIAHLFVVFYEEPTLQKQFGQSYEEYRRTVPRWIPRFKRTAPMRRRLMKVRLIIRRSLYSGTFWAAVAALGSLWAANEARKTAEISYKAIEIETHQVLLLDCKADFEKVGPRFQQTVRLLDTFPALLNGLMELSGHNPKSEDSSIRAGGKPESVYVCSLTNYGRLPALQIKFSFDISFVEGQRWPGPIKASHTHHLEVPALAPGSSFEFLIANASQYSVKLVPSTFAEIEQLGQGKSVPLHTGGWAGDLFLPPQPNGQ